MSGFLLADYLAGPRPLGLGELIQPLRKPTLGQLSKLVEALAAHLAARSAPSGFFHELAAWSRGDHSGSPPHVIARELVELRSDLAHSRKQPTPSRVGRIEALVREYLHALRWLARYDLVHVNDQALRRDQTFVGHWTLYRGKDRAPLPSRAWWAGGLASEVCYLLDRQAGRALDLADFFAVIFDEGKAEDVFLVVESCPDLKKVVLMQPCNGTTCVKRPLVESGVPGARDRYWNEAQPGRHVAVRILEP